MSSAAAGTTTICATERSPIVVAAGCRNRPCQSDDVGEVGRVVGKAAQTPNHDAAGQHINPEPELKDATRESIALDDQEPEDCRQTAGGYERHSHAHFSGLVDVIDVVRLRARTLRRFWSPARSSEVRATHARIAVATKPNGGVRRGRCEGCLGLVLDGLVRATSRARRNGSAAR